MDKVIVSSLLSVVECRAEPNIYTSIILGIIAHEAFKHIFGIMGIILEQ